MQHHVTQGATLFVPFFARFIPQVPGACTLCGSFCILVLCDVLGRMVLDAYKENSMLRRSLGLRESKGILLGRKPETIQNLSTTFS